MNQFLNKIKGLNETILIVIVVVAVAGFFIMNSSENEYGFVCPSDFTDREEYLTSVAKWISEYQKDHPDADTDEILDARDKLTEKYGCGSAPFEVAYEEPEFSERDIYEMVASHKLDEAIAASEQYLNIYPNDFDVWTHRGMAFFLLDKCPEAIDALSRGAKLQSEDDAEIYLAYKDPDYTLISDILHSVQNKCDK